MSDPVDPARHMSELMKLTAFMKNDTRFVAADRPAGPDPIDVYRTVVSALTNEKVSFLLHGGWAMLAYGYERATHDLDFIVPVEAEVCRTVYQIMKEAGGQVGTVDGPNAEAAIENRCERLNFEFGGWRVDLFRDPTFNHLAGRAIEIELGGRQIRVINPHDLRRKKLARGTHKDRIDVEWLLQRFGEEGNPP